jgi:hypothetical protein
MKTLDVPTIGTNPTLIFSASKRPYRVVVHNVGGAIIFLAFSINDLPDAQNVTSAFQLTVGRELIVFMVPGQTLVAAAGGGGGLVSVAMSENAIEVVTFAGPAGLVAPTMESSR